RLGRPPTSTLFPYPTLFRSASGVVFPAGYQAHGATETCPGHSTILTGNHPAHTGIVGNNFFDLSAAREDKRLYCAEDETVPGTSDRKSTRLNSSHVKISYAV